MWHCWISGVEDEKAGHSRHQMRRGEDKMAGHSRHRMRPGEDD